MDSETTITHTLTAQGTYWELDVENEEFPISDNVDLEEAYAIITGSITPNPTYQEPGAWKGFYFPWSPNPFNPLTKINYSILKDGFVSLKVFDILGNTVETLMNGYQIEGIHEVSFNALELPSGIYFYQLRTENFTDTKKMILLR